jgi:3-oxoacyl-[acyl-carrier protein] reductase
LFRGYGDRIRRNAAQRHDRAAGPGGDVDNRVIGGLQRAGAGSGVLFAVRINFARMRDRIPALKKLADRQGVERIDRLEDVLPVPGMMDTAPEGALSFFEKASPFGRIGRAQEIAAVVAFLALPEASWVSGAHILANGAANT